ncbi:unnamed protein product [Cylindrotheca closterium]|uniref:Lipoyl-binding domain-containing protein n=1 Tax=Cylindrotheca closterium TaxID=2856 RepID=A0AAD2CW73_9STRA|nr:unnamed protein product [Cylindrotheca closterium]
MRRLLLSIAVSALLNDAIGWISQPDTFHRRRSSLSFQSPMAPMDFIDVEVTGHAKESSNNTKRESPIKEEDKARTKEILMPSISAAMTKGKIVEWLVRTGDTIRKGDPIMVIESEKESQGARGYRTNQDVHANVDGVLAAIYQQPGQALDVGAVLGIIVPDYIIDVEVEGQPTTQANEGTAKDEPTVTTNTVNVSGGSTVGTTAESPSSSASSSSTNANANTKANTSSRPSMMDEIMPNTQNMKSTVPPGASDWVHQHHATTDGMVNDSSFYSSHQTQSSSGGSAGGGPRKGRFDVGIDNMDPFYSPYGEGGGGGGGGPGHMPRSQPPPQSYTAQTQPGPSMKPNGANDNFYEAYQGKRSDDPYVQQAKQWTQSTGGVGNSNMGDYYKAQQTGQAAPFNPTVSTGPDPNGYTGYDIPRSPTTVVNPDPQGVFVNGVNSDPQDVFVRGVSPPEVDPQDGYSSAFVNPSTTTTSSSPNTTPNVAQTTPSVETSNSTSTSTSTTSASTPAYASAVPPSVETPAATVPPSVENPAAVAPPPVETPAAVVPPAVEIPRASAFDQSQVNAMESRIANLEESLRTNGQDSFQMTIQAELDSLKTELSGVKTNYDDKVKALEESYQTSLSQVGREFTNSMEELRDWDTLTVTWDIKDFEKTLQNDLTTYTSEEFNVAGYSMTLEMQIFGTNDEGNRDVGFYIMHTGGLNYVPIMIGGSKIVIQSITGNDDAVKVFVDDASIEDSHYGWGWKKFFSLQDLKKSFVNSKGEIQVIANVRIKRVKNCHINTAI